MTEVAKLRDTPIEPEEFAKLEKARRTTDPRKLAAMMPTWLKRHIAKSRPPQPRAPFDPRVVVPNLCTRQTEPWAHYKFPNVEAVAEYVREFERLNNLLAPALAIAKPVKAHRPRHRPQREFDRFKGQMDGKVKASIAALKAHATRTVKALSLVTSEQDRAHLESRRQGFEARIHQLTHQQEAA